MKRLSLTGALIAITIIVLGQAPQAFNYQAILRNSDGTVKANETVALQISLIDDNGSSAFMEIHNTQTSQLGLINVVIGEGSTSDDLALVDWSSGPFFLDITVNGVHLGSSPILSVPYALHAKTAENGITTAQATIIAATSGTNTGDQDGSETKVTAGTNITVTGSGTTGSPYVVSATGDTTLAIGDSYQGGIIFWLDATGQHGLIAATTDQSTSMRWSAGTYAWTMAKADGVGAGKANTAIIIANQGYGDGATYAARICNEYSVTVGGVTYGDLYLPSKYELNLMYMNIGQGNLLGLGNVGGFDGGIYWSSTEDHYNRAWTQNFGMGLSFPVGKDVTLRVRPVRAF